LVITIGIDVKTSWTLHSCHDCRNPSLSGHEPRLLNWRHRTASLGKPQVAHRRRPAASRESISIKDDERGCRSNCRQPLIFSLFWRPEGKALQFIFSVDELPQRHSARSRRRGP
jgi:hypothetical protein